MAAGVLSLPPRGGPAASASSRPFSSAVLLILPALVPFLLGAVSSPASASSSLSCVCTPSECEEVREWECPGGGVVWDACGCCRVCARVEDEPCGGPEGFHGSCAPGLHCVLDPSQLLLPPPRGGRQGGAEARGTCKRVPGIQVGASPGAGDASSLGSSQFASGCVKDSDGRSAAFGCDIVGRVCRCSHLPACGDGTPDRDGEDGGDEDGGDPGSMGIRRRRRRDANEHSNRSWRRRRKRGGWPKKRKGDRSESWGPGGGDADFGGKKSPFTFSTLEECEMNLAEVLRQEEVPSASGRGE
ncbi:uncharacterized protein [Hetaerina americana]|uniref:uncharacterized protein n=1 Tax=Hetaerina americana TaxID=62018 RepID=UPI003A7F5855